MKTWPPSTIESAVILVAFIRRFQSQIGEVRAFVTFPTWNKLDINVTTSKKLLTRCSSNQSWCILCPGLVVGSGETTRVYGNSSYCASSTPTSLCTRGLIWRLTLTEWNTVTVFSPRYMMKMNDQVNTSTETYGMLFMQTRQHEKQRMSVNKSWLTLGKDSWLQTGPSRAPARHRDL